MVLKSEMRKYIYNVFNNASVVDKQKYAILGFNKYFSFEIASLFSYSMINQVGIGTRLWTFGKESSITDIMEDFSEIPVLFTAIENKQAQCFKEDELVIRFPNKYIERFNICHDFYVVPITYNSSVIGCSTLRKPRESFHSQKEVLQELTFYGQLLGEYFEIERVKKNKRKKLSDRETEVLQRMAFGETIKIMAANMGISEYTVRDYIRSTFIKLQVEHRAHAVAEALRQGYIS
ncbi:DNA-binding CsgD family transcriptional regulator [Neobacillus niacini]|uniref:response regulator transcription factor n=1 Tax=Neobacillus niacini TaxID=86668 RepID=UPI0027833295|nr:LuxR C-terminal-related transcriptional regulator [Neobacillus niacini]MDQ1002173.1 DNA-binding CsgD family transcriptional regulator [Neobacillus niacini]